jgi:hypothetical protein
MPEEDSNYERRLNSLLFDAANKTDEFVRHKIAIIEAGNALQESYLAALQQCCRKHDEVLRLEEYVLTRFQRALPPAQVGGSDARLSESQDAFRRVADHFVDPPLRIVRKVA